MIEEIKISLINLEDGKIRWKTQKESLELLANPELWKIYPNPDRLYFPEHDGNLNKKLGQEAKPIPAISDIGGKEILEVVIL